MRHNLITIVMHFLAVSCVHAQVSARDSINREVEAYAKEVGKDAGTFLDNRLPQQVRLAAIKPHVLIYDSNQIRQFKAVVLSEKEGDDIRAMALNKIYRPAYEDAKVRAQIIRWLGDPAAPKVLRYETLNMLKSVTFSSVGVLDVYQKLVTDSDVNFRAFAVSRLIAYGDARTQQLLIDGLEDSSSALFTVPQSIAFLSLAPKKDFLPAAHKILLTAKDADARLAALRVLGPYTQAKKDLVGILQSPKELEEFREAALRALYQGYHNEIITHVAYILQDPSATARLQALGIRMSIDNRGLMSFRKSKAAAKADSYDMLVRDIANGKGSNASEDLLKVASEYLVVVRPNFKQ